MSEHPKKKAEKKQHEKCMQAKPGSKDEAFRIRAMGDGRRRNDKKR